MSAFRAVATTIGTVIIGAALTAGCGAGKEAQTAYEKPSLDGTQGQVGDIQLEGVAMQAPKQGLYATGASVPLTVYLVNTGTSADSLTNITSTGFTGGWSIVSSPDASAQPSGSSGSSGAAGSASGSAQQIGAGSAVGFGLQGLTADGTGSPETILLKNIKTKLFPGDSLQITFSFAKAGQTTLTVPVEVTSTTEAPTASSSPSA